jgi:nitrate/nitrite transporter NarK
MVAVAAVLLWAAGGPVLLFVRTEYNAGAGSFGVAGRIGLGPIVAGISLVSSHDATAWMVLAIAMIVALLLVMATLAKHKLRFRIEPQISCRS